MARDGRVRGPVVRADYRSRVRAIAVPQRTSRNESNRVTATADEVKQYGMAAVALSSLIAGFVYLAA